MFQRHNSDLNRKPVPNLSLLAKRVDSFQSSESDTMRSKGNEQEDAIRIKSPISSKINRRIGNIPLQSVQEQQSMDEQSSTKRNQRFRDEISPQVRFFIAEFKKKSVEKKNVVETLKRELQHVGMRLAQTQDIYEDPFDEISQSIEVVKEQQKLTDQDFNYLLNNMPSDKQGASLLSDNSVFALQSVDNTHNKIQITPKLDTELRFEFTDNETNNEKSKKHNDLSNCSFYLSSDQRDSFSEKGHSRNGSRNRQQNQSITPPKECQKIKQEIISFPKVKSDKIKPLNQESSSRNINQQNSNDQRGNIQKTTIASIQCISQNAFKPSPEQSVTTPKTNKSTFETFKKQVPKSESKQKSQQQNKDCSPDNQNLGKNLSINSQQQTPKVQDRENIAPHAQSVQIQEVEIFDINKFRPKPRDEQNIRELSLSAVSLQSSQKSKSNVFSKAQMKDIQIQVELPISNQDQIVKEQPGEIVQVNSVENKQGTSKKQQFKNQTEVSPQSRQEQKPNQSIKNRSNSLTDQTIHHQNASCLEELKDHYKVKKQKKSVELQKQVEGNDIKALREVQTQVDLQSQDSTNNTQLMEAMIAQIKQLMENQQRKRNLTFQSQTLSFSILPQKTLDIQYDPNDDSFLKCINVASTNYFYILAKSNQTLTIRDHSISNSHHINEGFRIKLYMDYAKKESAIFRQESQYKKLNIIQELKDRNQVIKPFVERQKEHLEKKQSFVKKQNELKKQAEENEIKRMQKYLEIKECIYL